eukprot:scaffold248335_cov43-Cyclotella_meneghiniana.AAC.1
MIITTRLPSSFIISPPSLSHKDVTSNQHTTTMPLYRISSSVMTSTTLLMLSLSHYCLLMSHYAAVVTSLSSSFHGQTVPSCHNSHPHHRRRCCNSNAVITMRKQKASDKHTARKQRGLLEQDVNNDYSSYSTISTTRQILSSTTFTKNEWKDKKIELRSNNDIINTNKSTINVKGGGGRGRARKRYNLYNSLL